MSRRYPDRPVVGVGAIVADGDRVLLVRRGKPPLEGFWSLPGGAVNVGESLEDALRREVREEVGLEVEVVNQAEVFERVTRDQSGEVEYHYVLIDYLCRSRGGQPQAADDAADAAWFEVRHLVSNPDELPMTEGTLAVIQRAFEHAGFFAERV